MANEEGLNINDIYRKEIKGIRPCTDAEMKALPAKIGDGSYKAAERLIEGNLWQVIDIAEKLCTFAKEEGDAKAEENLAEWIQEGNLALTMAVYDYRPEDGDFDKYVKTEIVRALNQVRDSEKTETENDRQIAAKLNLVTEASSLLANELGRQPSAAEIAEKLSMTEDEVENAIRIAMEAMTETVDVPDEGEME